MEVKDSSQAVSLRWIQRVLLITTAPIVGICGGPVYAAVVRGPTLRAPPASLAVLQLRRRLAVPNLHDVGHTRS